MQDRQGYHEEFYIRYELKLFTNFLDVSNKLKRERRSFVCTLHYFKRIKVTNCWDLRMVVQTVALGFTAASNKDKRDSTRSTTKSASTTPKIQWPEFKVSQPDPVLGKLKNISHKDIHFYVEVLQARFSRGRAPLLPSRLWLSLFQRLPHFMESRNSLCALWSGTF